MSVKISKKIPTNDFKYTVEEILEKYDITIEGTVNGNYICSCCFHNDTGNPNLSIEVETGLYKCWSCNASGNLVTLVAHLEGTSTKDAYRMLSQGQEIDKDIEYLKPFVRKEVTVEHKFSRRLHLMCKYIFGCLYNTAIPKYISSKIDKKILDKYLYEQQQIVEDYDDSYRRYFTIRKREQFIIALKTIKELPEKDQYRKLTNILSNSQLKSVFDIVVDLIDFL